MADDRCLNCNATIRLVNYSLGKRWMHVDPDASFPTEQRGTAWRFCRATVGDSNHAHSARRSVMSDSQNATENGRDVPCPECDGTRWATGSDGLGGVTAVAAVCVSCGYVTISVVDLGTTPIPPGGPS